MTIKGSYLLTVLVSVILVFAGYKFAVKDLVSFQQAPQETARAKVQKVFQKTVPLDDFGEIIPMMGEKVDFEAKISNGTRKGEIVTGWQNLGGFSGIAGREVKAGDRVLLVNFDNEWFFSGYYSIDKLIRVS
jgi:hypothetical protein